MAGKKGRSGGNRVAKDDPFPLDGMPSIADGASEAEKATFRELLAAIPQEMLRKVDKHQLSMLARLICTERKLGKLVADDPEDARTVRAYLAVCQQVGRVSSLYGLSPVDRQRLRLGGSGGDQEESGFGALLARASGVN